jgi:hypothetical protein
MPPIIPVSGEREWMRGQQVKVIEDDLDHAIDAR